MKVQGKGSSNYESAGDVQDYESAGDGSAGGGHVQNIKVQGKGVFKL